MSSTSVACNDGLQAATEGRTRIADLVAPHVLPLLVHRGLQIGDIAVASSAGLTFHLSPDAVVQGV